MKFAGASSELIETHPVAQEERMTGRQILIEAVEKAGIAIAKHIDPRITSDPEQTINRLITVLDMQEVAGAITRLKAGFGLKVVKPACREPTA
jgi:hypothetical protein